MYIEPAARRPLPLHKCIASTCITLIPAAHHRKTPAPLKNRDQYLFDDFSTDLRKHVLRRGGARVKLPSEAFDALATLLQKAPNVVAPERLRAAIWGEGVVEHHVLAEIVDTVRKALGERPEGGPYVETVAKSGYRFTAPVQRVRRERPPTAWHALAPAAIAAVVLLGAFAMWRIAAARTPLNPEAVRLHRAGMALWAEARQTPEDEERDFRQAIRLQPSYAPAHAGLAAVLAVRTYPALDAKAEVQKALALDPSLADAHAVQGFVRMFQDWNWNGARDSFERALKLEPGNALATQWYGMWLALQGRAAEAEQMLDRGAAANPASMRMLEARCQVLYLDGRFAEAAPVCEAGLARNRESRFLRGLLSRIYAALGRFGEAGEMMPLERQARLRNAPAAQGGRGFYAALCDAADSPFDLARCKAGQEDRDAAIVQLEEAVRTHQFGSVFIGADPAYRILHPERRFQDLCRQVGVPCD
jgi:DNA-binding winged helix-turn-helix (wHTH) protein